MNLTPELCQERVEKACLPVLLNQHSLLLHLADRDLVAEAFLPFVRHLHDTFVRNGIIIKNWIMRFNHVYVVFAQKYMGPIPRKFVCFHNTHFSTHKPARNCESWIGVVGGLESVYNSGCFEPRQTQSDGLPDQCPWICKQGELVSNYNSFKC